MTEVGNEADTFRVFLVTHMARVWIGGWGEGVGVGECMCAYACGACIIINQLIFPEYAFSFHPIPHSLPKRLKPKSEGNRFTPDYPFTLYSASAQRAPTACHI